MFENEYIMTRKYTKEYVYHILCQKIILVGMTIFLFGLLLFFFLQGSIRYVMFTASFVAVACAVLGPIVMVRQLEETSKRLNNGKIEKTQICFGHNIVMNEGKVHLEFAYKQIRSVVQTKHFIVLKLSNDAAIVVFKDGFIKGSQDEFLPFIRDKIG